MIHTLKQTAVKAACAAAGAALCALVPTTAHAASTGNASAIRPQPAASSATVRSQQAGAVPAYTSPCTYTNTEPVIGFGNTGAAVEQAQCLLDEVYGYPLTGSPLTIDGNFGEQTRAWTEFFQAQSGFTVDGIIGPQTWPWLYIVAIEHRPS